MHTDIYSSFGIREIKEYSKDWIYIIFAKIIPLVHS